MKARKRSNFGYNHFVQIILTVNLILFILCAYPIYIFLGYSRLIAVVSAIVITTLNAIFSYFVIIKYSVRSFNAFVSAFFGSMGIRLFIMAGIIIGFILLIKIDQFSFIISLFISYICDSIIEIYFIVKKSQEIEIKNLPG